MNTTDIALLILRLAAGTTLLVHGWPKVRNWKGTFLWLLQEKFPLPFLATLGVCLTEVFGGVFLLLGIGVRVAALIGIFVMLTAATYEWRKHKTYAMRAEVPLLVAAMLLVLLVLGGGALSIAP
jgi:putative oxidoreductase